MQMSKEEFESLMNNLSNDEVAEVLWETLNKLHLKLEMVLDEMSEAEKSMFKLFESFLRTYNTILRLSEVGSFVFKPEISYIDIRSIYILMRSCHELYLLFNYMGTNTIGDCSCDEKDFKYNCYKLSGIVDEERMLETIKNEPNYQEIYNRRIVYLQNQISECKKKICESPIYKILSPKVKDLVKMGYWRVDAKKKLTWNNLLDYTPMSKKYGVSEYHVLSSYLHSSHVSLELEAQHNYDMNGALCHLYKLGALMCITTLNTFKFELNLLEKREVALLMDLKNMGNSLM